MNKAEHTLGRVAAGKPKNYTSAELARRKSANHTCQKPEVVGHMPSGEVLHLKYKGRTFVVSRGILERKAR